MNIQVIIPFRLREGADPRRAANLEIVQAWWHAHGFDPKIVSDGLDGDAQFNRHRAYNRAVSGNPDAEVYVFTEADMLIHPDHIHLAARLAKRAPGLVVPFTEYRYLSDETTRRIRDTYHDATPQQTADWWSVDRNLPGSVFQLHPESTMEGGRSIGAVNVVSAKTLEVTGGFTEATRGNWYDDNIIEEGFAFLTGRKTAFVPGPAVHMYHLPGHTGDHLSAEDVAATEHNRMLLLQTRRAIRQRRKAWVRELMAARQ